MSECTRSNLYPFLDMIAVITIYHRGLYKSQGTQRNKHRTCCRKSHVLCFFKQKYHQCVSETGADKAVDDEVGAGVQHDHEPDHGIHHPPGGRDVVLALPFHALKYVGNG